MTAADRVAEIRAWVGCWRDTGRVRDYAWRGVIQDLADLLAAYDAATAERDAALARVREFEGVIRRLPVGASIAKW